MNLYIVCHDYPFGMGEPYLENELIVIQNKFDKVYIILPEYTLGAKKESHFMPQGSQVITFDIKPSKERSKSILKALTIADFYKEMFTVLFKYKQFLTFARLKNLVSYFSKSQAFINEFDTQLKDKIKPGDVLYTYWCTEYTYAIAKLQNKYNVKAITRMHGWDVYYERNVNNYLPLRPAIFNMLKSIYVVSNNGRNYLLNKISAKYSNKIKASYLGTLNPSFTQTNKVADLHIVSLSNIVPVKQLNKIIDALCLIDDIHIIWTHIGGDYNQNTNFNEFEKNVKEKLKDKFNIRYELLGNKNKSEVYSLLENSGYHCMVNTSNYEGLPVSFMEALSFGIPIIAPNVGGIPEIVEHGVNGFLTEVRPKPQAIANAIKLMAKLDNNQYTTIRSNAYKVWENKFNAEKNYTEFAEDIKSL